MVNNSTNTNKQSPLTFTHRTQKKDHDIKNKMLEIQTLGWDRHKNVEVLNRLMVSHPYLQLNIQGNAYIFKR